MNIDALIRRAFLLLEDGEYDKASELLDKVLNEEPENALAYVGLLCVDLKVRYESDLANYKEPIAEFNNFKKAVRFGDASLVERLNGYNSAIINRLNTEAKENYYLELIKELEIANWLPDNTEEQCINKSVAFSQLAEKIHTLGNYKNSMESAEACEKAAIDLKMLAEQRKEESLIAKAIKRKKRKKRLLVTLGIISVFIVGIIGYKIFNDYYKSIPGKYHIKYNEALANADFDTAMELYKKYLSYYDPNDKNNLVTDVNIWDENLFELKEKDAIIANSIRKFAEKCEFIKTANEAFDYICNGDIEKGNELFIDSRLSLSWVSENHLKEKLPEFLNNINAVEVINGSFALYWLNEDGTVGRIRGNPAVDDWKDIEEIKVSGDYDIAGLKKDGTVISDKYSIENVVDYAIGAGYLVALRPDGTVTWCGDTPPIQSGFDDVLNWSDVKSIKYLDETVVKTTIIDPDGVFWKEYSNANLGLKTVPCLGVTTNDDKTLFSAYNIKIIYPTADEVARNIVSSIDGGWDKVIEYLRNHSLSIGSGGIMPKVEFEPITIYGFSENDPNTIQIGSLVFERDSDGKWYFAYD